MSKKVLIVDDNEMNRKLCRLLLQKNGFETIEAEDGATGIKMAKEHLPSLILMDIQMPVMDGIAAMKAIRAEPETASIPVIALTSYAMKEDKEKFLAKGFDGYISKPICKNSFIDAVLKMLRPE
ncbi:MAG: response regulator [Nitrospirota bacterium]|nr:response regulator [Nitrospirota bacterium]